MQRNIVEERGAKNIVVMDVFSKLVQERIIFIEGFIDEELANGVIAQVLYLDSLNNNTIHIYINSQGGDILSGLAIYDVCSIIRAPIRTICVGAACSMAAILLLMGQERCGLKHSRVMFHQAQAGMHDNTAQLQVRLELVKKLQSELYEIVENKTNLRDVEKLFLLDTWFSADEALESGILTKIL